MIKQKTSATPSLTYVTTCNTYNNAIITDIIAKEQLKSLKIQM